MPTAEQVRLEADILCAEVLIGCLSLPMLPQCLSCYLRKERGCPLDRTDKRPTLLLPVFCGLVLVVILVTGAGTQTKSTETDVITDQKSFADELCFVFLLFSCGRSGGHFGPLVFQPLYKTAEGL